MAATQGNKVCYQFRFCHKKLCEPFHITVFVIGRFVGRDLLRPYGARSVHSFAPRKNTTIYICMITVHFVTFTGRKKGSAAT
jgi:hypothetical protein